MKLLLLALAIFATANAHHNSRALLDDFNEIISLVPTEEVLKIVLAHITDPELLEAIAYLNSSEFLSLVEWLNQQPAYLNIVQYLNEHLGSLPRIPKPSTRDIHKTQNRTLLGMLQEILAVLPVEEILAKIEEKKATSADFAEFWSILTSEDMHAFMDQFLQHPEYKNIEAKLQSIGIDITAYYEIVYKYFGWA